MSSVNEVNAYQRGLAEGRRQGEAVMRTAGSTAKEAYKLGKFTHWAKILIAFVIGFLVAIATDAHAQATAETSVTVVITAEVACNPENCPETIAAMEEPAQVQSVQPEGTWWSKVVDWWKKLIT